MMKFQHLALSQAWPTVPPSQPRACSLCPSRGSRRTSVTILKVLLAVGVQAVPVRVHTARLGWSLCLRAMLRVLAVLRCSREALGAACTCAQRAAGETCRRAHAACHERCRRGLLL